MNDLGGARDGTGSGSAAADAVVEEIRVAGGEAVANHGSVADEAGGVGVVVAAVETFGRVGDRGRRRPGPPGRPVPYGRGSANAARSSSISTDGTSSDAKCPPRGSSFQ